MFLQITSYLDASNVYSSSEQETKNLRDLSNDNGLLKEGQSLEIGQMPLLPYNVFSDLDSGNYRLSKIIQTGFTEFSQAFSEWAPI